jgi:tRNA1Val (adenine37-N6)-methyltransferase
MSETIFHFKPFTINQDKCAMKVGTDAVLLGSWIKPKNASNILDIGTGTGVIALMLAQKSDSHIDAIDIDESAYTQAKENFLTSPWKDRLNCLHQSLQDFSCSTNFTYDLIAANPPYFHQASKPLIPSRTNARHSECLTFDDLAACVKKLLKPGGRFCVILPSKEGMVFLDKAQRLELFCHHLVRVKTKADRDEKRLIMEFGFQFGLLTEEEIIIHEEDGSFTPEYIELTSDYYFQLKQFPSNFL